MSRRLPVAYAALATFTPRGRLGFAAVALLPRNALFSTRGGVRAQVWWARSTSLLEHAITLWRKERSCSKTWPNGHRAQSSGRNCGDGLLLLLNQPLERLKGLIAALALLF